MLAGLVRIEPGEMWCRNAPGPPCTNQPAVFMGGHPRDGELLAPPVPACPMRSPIPTNPCMRVDMAKLSDKQRAKLPAKDFGLPERARSAVAKQELGNYPAPDTGHAISAKRLARKNRKDGNLTKDEFDRIDRKADKVLKAKAKD